MHRKNAEISALSSGELDNYEYLIGKDLEYKPNPLQKAKFEYSSLGQVFNKGLDKEEKLEGLLKRNRKSIVINNEVLMELEKEIKDKENEIKKKESSKNKDDKDKAIFNYTASDGTENDFTEDIKLLNFPEDLYKRKLTFDVAEKEQEEMIKKISDLKKELNQEQVPNH